MLFEPKLKSITQNKFLAIRSLKDKQLRISVLIQRLYLLNGSTN